MAENIFVGLLLAAAFGGIFSLFYTMLLKEHGFSFKYIQVAICLAIPIFLLSFISLKVAGIACAIIGAGVFVLAITLIIRSTGETLKLSKEKLTQNFQPEKQEERPIISYYGMVFHLCLALLIIFSMFIYTDGHLLSEERMAILIADANFQFGSTLLLVFIGIFNPFQRISDQTIAFFIRFDAQKYPKWHVLLSDYRSWTVIKIIICILFTFYFIYNGYLTYPRWDNNSQTMNAYVLMVGIFIIISLNQLIRNPEIFFKKNLFRITMLFKSVYLGIFVAIILLIVTLFLSKFTDKGVEHTKITSESILFLGFNLVMAYNEYKVAGK